MKSIILPTYFPPIFFWKIIIQNNFRWIKKSFYKKQTLRNRTYIHAANGKLILSIPIKHSGKNIRRFYDDISIDSSSNWRKNHFKSIKIAYQSSPYFEFYEDDLIKFYQNNIDNLYNFNLESIKLVSNWLNLRHINDTIEFNVDRYKQSETIQKIDSKEITKNNNINYTQNFEEKNGFIHGLGILDIIFNCGPNTKDYIKAGL